MAQLDKILRTAVEYKASDIYITTGQKPILRITGRLVPVEEHAVLTTETAQAYIYELMNERQRAEFEKDYDTDFSIEIPGTARFRANVFMQRLGIGAIFRLIPAQVPTMEQLMLPEQLRRIPHYQNGIVLVTGPTGSGKSSTLAAVINEINTQLARHIITIEDPIEFVHQSNRSVIEQREVGQHTASFSNALRAALREDTDVILVGEMRDLETISLALTAAETGHLVLATLHTAGAASTVNRVIDVFPAGQQSQIRTQLAGSLRAVAWQSLLRHRDGKSRVAAFELMFCNAAIANLIRENKVHQITSALETGAQEGMQTMKKSVLGMLAAGLISEQEAQENIPEEFE